MHQIIHHRQNYHSYEHDRSPVHGSKGDRNLCRKGDEDNQI